MATVRKVLVKSFAGIAVFAGVSSLITLGIMVGVKVAYAASGYNVMANEEEYHYVFVLEAVREQQRLDRDLIDSQAKILIKSAE